MDAVEIRVHGIGDQGALGALGSGALVPAEDDTSGVETYRLPPIPNHRILFLNWSRTSHRRARFLWYLALPFTLVNLAGHMAPAGSAPVARAARAVHRGVSFGMGVVLSVAFEGWLIVIVETFLKWEPGVTQRSATGAALAVGGLLAVTTLVRAWRRATVAAGVVHAACFLAVALLVVVYRPAQIPHVGWPNSCSQSLVRSTCNAGTLDVMTGFVVVSLVIGLVAAALMTVLHLVLRTRSAAPGGAGAVAAAVVMIGALVIVHTVGWGLRYSLDWILNYFDALSYQPKGLKPGERLLQTATEYEARPFAPLARVSELTTAVVVALAVAAVAVNVVAALGGMRGRHIPSRQRFARFVHDAVTSLGARLPWIVGLSIPLSVVLATVPEPGLWTASAAPITAAYLDLFAGGLILVVLVLAFSRRVRSVLGTMADVAGFWPVMWHPLAGTSYRDDVVAGIGRTLDRQGSVDLALVGHSQGSVLCAWLAATRDPTRQATLHLVTCGSPLKSLYATFFPVYFGDQFFDAVRSNVTTWLNAWRRTDPIATELAGPDPGCNVEIADATTGRLRGHGDYWTEEQLNEHLAHQLRGAAVTGRVSRRRS